MSPVLNGLQALSEGLSEQHRLLFDFPSIEVRGGLWSL